MAKKKGGSAPPRQGGPAKQGSRGRRRGLVVFGILVAVVIALAAIGAAKDDDKGDDKPAATTDTTSSASCVSDSRMDHYSSGDKVPIVHTDSPSYEGPLAPRDNPSYSVNPPSGGDHLSVAVGPGLYEGDRVPPDGRLVHSLEHGYVIIWFKPDISDSDKQTLEDVFSQYRRDTLVVERANMDRPVAVTAWGHRMLCDGADAKKLGSFIEDFANKAPERIPH